MVVRFRTLALASLAMLPSAPVLARDTAVPVDALGLDQAVALALQHNHAVRLAAQDVARAETRIAAARTRRLPNLELQAMAGTTLNTIRVSYPAGAFGSYPGIGPIPSEDTEVEAPRALSGNVTAILAQPLTQLHAIGLNTKLSELDRDAQREKLRGERAAVVADVRRLYYGLLQTESALRTKRDQLDVYRELDRVVGEQLALEAALPADALEVKARLAAEESDLAELEGDLATARERMNLLLGRELDHAFAVVPVQQAAPEEANLESALAVALARRPDLAQTRIAIEQADTDRRLKQAEWIPELSLAVSYTSYVNVDLLPRNVAMAGVQLKWEPFDWGRRGKERAEKEIRVEQARSDARDAESRIRIEVGERFRDLHEARLRVGAEGLALEAARESLRVVASRHGQDAALLKDVLEAQAALSGAQARYDSAVLALWTAKAEFQNAMGEEL